MTYTSKYIHCTLLHYPITNRLLFSCCECHTTHTHTHTHTHSPSSSCILITVALGVPSSTPVGALLRLSVAISSSTASRATTSSVMGNVMLNELVPAGKVAVKSMDPPDGDMNWVSLRAVCVSRWVCVCEWIGVCVCGCVCGCVRGW